MYILFESSNGHVVKITESEPTEIELGHEVIESDMYRPGDEFMYYIVITLDNDGKMVSSSAVRQSAPAEEIMRKMVGLQQENAI